MDKQKESNIPDMLSPEWNDYVMKFFTDNAFILKILLYPVYFKHT